MLLAILANVGESGHFMAPGIYPYLNGASGVVISCSLDLFLSEFQILDKFVRFSDWSTILDEFSFVMASSLSTLSCSLDHAVSLSSHFCWS